jgi:pectinesterase
LHTPEGWDNWGNAENEKTVSYLEYKNSGNEASIGKRVSWSKQITNKQAAMFTVENILGTDLPYLKQQENWFNRKVAAIDIWPSKK